MRLTLWMVYGIIATVFLYFSFPHLVMGNLREIIFFVLFAILGGLDQLASVILKKKNRTIKY